MADYDWRWFLHPCELTLLIRLRAIVKLWVRKSDEV